MSLNTGEEYSNFVRQFASLVDEQFKRWEQLASSNDLINLVQQLPAAISLVNTVGYLRGQDNVFTDFRPQTENQKEFYGYEHAFEDRLAKLIETVMSSDMKDEYRKRLERYFVEVRTSTQDKAQ